MQIFFVNGKQYRKSDIPATLRPFADHIFSSGSTTGEDYKSFQRKYKNVIAKGLPEGYTIHSWHPNHYDFSAVIRNPQGKFIYMSISDVRFFVNGWVDDILIRTMEHDKDWNGGPNNRTSVFTFAEDIKKLYPEDKNND